jgi:hypothetical protein
VFRKDEHHKAMGNFQQHIYLEPYSGGMPIIFTLLHCLPWTSTKYSPTLPPNATNSIRP